MQQLSIFDAPATTRARPRDPPRARREDPPSSQLAAAQAGRLASEHQAKILEALDQADGTIYELAARTGLTAVQVARRTSELKAAGAATTTDETRVSPSGRACRVWARAR